MEGQAENQRRGEYYANLQYSILLHEVEDEGKRYWIAEVPELPGCTSHGSTVEEAVESVQEAKKDWILDSLEKGEEVPIPVERERYSGRTLLRMSRSLHRALSLMAESEKLSLNQLLVTILAKEVGRFNVLNRVERKIDELLDRVDDVLEERRAPSTKPTLMWSRVYEAERPFMADAGPDIRGQVDLGTFYSWAAFTVAPQQEPWNHHLLPLISARTGFEVAYVTEEEPVEIRRR